MFVCVCVSDVYVWAYVCARVRVFQTVTALTGAPGVAGPVSVRTGPSASPGPGPAAASRGSSGATARTTARWGPTARAACTGACVGTEGRVTKPPESACVGTASPEHSECTLGSPGRHGNRVGLVTIATPLSR